MTAPAQPLFGPEEAQRNEALERELVEVLCSGEAIAFIGAGSSHSSGYPLWTRLLTMLAEAAKEVDETFIDDSHAAPLDRAQAIYDCINRARGVDHWHGKISQIFRPEHTPVQFHVDLVSLPFRGYLTTNYDLLLERTIDQQKRAQNASAPLTSSVPVHRGDGLNLAKAIRKLVANQPADTVIHLHGCVGHPPSFVLAASEYKDAYGFDPRNPGNGPRSRMRLESLLSALMMTRRLVFIGFSHEDLFIRDVLTHVTDTTWEWSETIHFAILPIDPVSPDPHKQSAKRLAEQMGIATLFYEAPNHDHSGRDSLVRRLVEQVRTRCGQGATDREPLDSSPAPAAPVTTPEWVRRANARAMTATQSNEH